MTDVSLSAQFQELSSALQRRATFVQRSDYKAQISYVADLLDRSAQQSASSTSSQTQLQSSSEPYQPANALGTKINVVA